MKPQKKRRPYKRTVANGVTTIEISVSSLRLIQSCQRKANYIMNERLTNESSYHADFGTLIHKTLEEFYLAPKHERSKELIKTSWERIFKEYEFVAQDEKKTFETGLAAMSKYAEMFENDDYEVLFDKDGKPMVEYEFEFEAYNDGYLIIKLFGTIDMVVKHTLTSEIFVMDHKTTSQLGVQFMNMWNPNHQMSAYIWAVKQMGCECNSAIIQGIQIVKTKQEIVRLTTRRDDDSLSDFIDTLKDQCESFSEHTDNGYFPSADNYTCAEFGGCGFIAYCQASLSNRIQMIKSKQNELRSMEVQNGEQSVTA